MSQFRLNGEVKPLTNASLAELIAGEGLAVESAIAVAVNSQVVPRARWSEIALNPGDAVEIVKPFSGG